MNNQVTKTQGQPNAVFENIFIARGGDEKQGPGTLTMMETEVRWETEETSPSRWNMRFEEMNLHAIGTEENEEQSGDTHVGYVLVQFGDECNEVRLISTDQSALPLMYRAFCEGVARCPASDDEQFDNDNGDVDTNGAGTYSSSSVLRHLDSLFAPSVNGEHAGDGNVTNSGASHLENDGEDDSYDDDTRWADAEDAIEPPGNQTQCDESNKNKLAETS